MGERRDEDDTEPDAIERKLATVKERLRQAKARLDTREHAQIDPRRREQDDVPTRPVIDFPPKR